MEVFILTKHSSRCPCHHVLAVVQFPDVLPYVGPSDAGVTLDVHVVSQSQQHLNTQKRQSQSETRTHPWSQMTGRCDNVGGATFWICPASSLVGARIRAWVSLTWGQETHHSMMSSPQNLWWPLKVTTNFQSYHMIFLSRSLRSRSTVNPVSPSRMPARCWSGLYMNCLVFLAVDQQISNSSPFKQNQSLWLVVTPPDIVTLLQQDDAPVVTIHGVHLRCNYL